MQQGEGDEESRIGGGLEASLNLAEESVEEEGLPPEFPYQTEAKRKLIKRKRSPLISPPGSGKTRTLLAAWHESDRPYPLLIIIGRNGSAEWLGQFEKWLGLETWGDITVLTGMSPTDRFLVYQDVMEGSREGQILLATWQTLVRDKQHILNIYWGCVIFDEAHKLFNHKSDVSKFIAKLKTDYMWLATGTEMRKGPQNLYSLLNICYPKTFKSYWKYVGTYCEVIDGYYGKEIIGARNADTFNQYLLPKFTAYVDEDEVKNYLPEKQVVRLSYEMSPSQRKYYDQLEEQVVTLIEESDTIKLGALAITRLITVRQLMTCPKAIDSNWDYGGAVELICGRLEEDPHIVIFVPFVPAIPYLQERLHKEDPHATIGVLKGGMTPKEVAGVIDRFEKDPKGIVIISIAFGESFSITTCKTAYVIGNTYMPDVYKQATDRIRRASTIHKRVTIYDLVCRGTVDELVLAVRNGYTRTIAKALGRLKAKKRTT